MGRTVALFVTGVVAMVALYMATGWWLDSAGGVAVTAIALAVLAAVAAPAWRQAIALWAGVVAGMIGVLFWDGPGTIFPIVIGIGAGIAAVAVAIGSVAGLAIRAWHEP